MNASARVEALQARLQKRDIILPREDVATLRRQERRLHRWCELECGDSNDYASWVIVRDEATGKPFMEHHSHRGDGKFRRIPVADNEKGALKRIQAVCDSHMIFFYYQTDPRGCALYISKEPINDQNYTNGIPVCD